MPFESWKPTIKQERFLSLPLSIKEGFYAGAAGAGKSDVLLMYPITHQWIKNPNFKGLFLRRTMPELREEIIPRSVTKLKFEKYGGKFTKNDSVWEFESGALFFFGHCEHEDDVHKYDSAQWNYVAFDELTSFTEWQYIYLTFERIRRDKAYPDLPAISRSASNPGNIGHAWVRKRFIDPAPKGMKIIEGRGGNKRIFIPATLSDNPHIDPEYGKSLDALPEAERQAKKFGSWDAYQGQVFEEFRDRQYPDEPENAIHVVDEFLIPEWWPKIYIIDWGFRAQTWVGMGAISPFRKLYIYREMSFTKAKIEEWAAYVKAYVDKESPRVIKVCKSAGQDRGQEHTVQKQIEDALGSPVELTNNSRGTRVAGKLLLHEYLRWRKLYMPVKDKEMYSEERAQWIFRNLGNNAYNQYMLRFATNESEEQIPKLQIFKNCTLLIDAIKSAVYSSTIKEDVAEYDGDDPYDGIRYMVDAAERFFGESQDLMKKVEKQAAIEEEFAKNKDYNKLFMRARADQKNEARAVWISRYHHVRH